MVALDVRVLGPPEVRVAGELTRITTWKAVALLGYLAVESGAHARPRLAALFWPDATPEVAQSSLRNALTALRRALGPCAVRLVTDRLTVQLQFTPEDRLDVHALLNGDPDAYRGDFLEGVPLEAADALGSWLEGQRDRLRTLAGRVYDVHTRTLLDTAPGLAVDAARRWLSLDDLNEEAWRRLIQAHHAAGQPQHARAALTACHTTLLRELGMAPAPETVALALPVAATPDRVDACRLPLSHGRSSVFVGRSGEQAQLRAAFQSVVKGDVHVVALAGEPGIGKTTLAETFAGWSRNQGARVLRGRALPTQGLTLGAWSDLVRSAVEAEFSPQDLDARWRVEMARVVPEWAPGDASPAETPRDLTFLFEALARTLATMAGNAPLVLLLDDVQWMDSSSRDALTVLMYRLPKLGIPVLVVLTVRAEHLGSEPALVAWLTGLGRAGPLERLDLGPLSEAETQMFVNHHAHGADARDVGAWLYDQSRGQPLYLRQALRALVEQDAIKRDADRWELRWPNVPSLAPGIREVIEERCARLPASGQAIIQACAVLGDQATFAVLHQVSGLDEHGALSGCEALLHAGLVLERPDAADIHYILSHDRVRETVYGTLSAPRCQLLHRRALAALQPHTPPDVLAWHAVQGGQYPEARDLLRQSAREASRLGFSGAARSALERALALEPEDREHVELLLLYAEACERLGDVDGQRRAGTDAFQKAQDLALSDLVVQSLNRLAWVDAETPSGGRLLSEQALALARTLGDPSLLASSLQGVARSYRHENPAYALTLQEEAMTYLQTLGDARRLGFGHMNAAYSHFALGDEDRGLSHLHEAIGVFRAARHVHLVAITLAELGSRLVITGQASPAAPVMEEAVALRERSRPRAPVFRAVWACALAEAGDLEAGWVPLLVGLEEPIEPSVWRLTVPWIARFLLACGQTGTALVLLGAAQGTSGLDGRTEPQVAAAVLAKGEAELGRLVMDDLLRRGHDLSLDAAVALLHSLAPG